MRLTLEKQDVLKLLGTALGYDIQDDDVEVKTEPFEIHIKKIRVAETSERPAKPAKTAVQDRVPTPSATSSSLAEDYDEGPGDLSLELTQSASLAALLPSALIDPDSMGLNDFSRPLRPGETEDPPGEDFRGELPR